MSESFGVAGTLGLDSSGNDYLQILYLLNYPKAVLPVFQSWLRSPFLSTQLYGLLGLHELDPAAFRQVAPRRGLCLGHQRKVRRVGAQEPGQVHLPEGVEPALKTLGIRLD